MRWTTKRPDSLRLGLLGVAGAAAAAALAWSLASTEGADPRPFPAPAAPPVAPRASIVAPVEAAQPAPSLEGIRLIGLLGAGAVLELAETAQAYVPVGREFRPGLRLDRVEPDHAVIAWTGGEARIGFDGAASGPPANDMPAAAPGPAAPAGVREQRLARESLQFRLGLAPRRAAGRITGFAIRNRSDLPRLREAGLRPGDVVVAVNGQPFDSEEKVHELAREIEGAFTATFEFERNGRRMKSDLEVHPRG